MKTPSVETLSRIFGDKAAEAKRILTWSHWDALAPLRESIGLHTGATKWQIKLTALCRLGDFHGVETIALGDGSFVDYLNAGDTYATTLYRWRGNYYVGCWGDLVERHGSMDLNYAIMANGFRQH